MRQNISETFRDRDLVSTDHQQEMTHGESNDRCDRWRRVALIDQGRDPQYA